MEQSNISNKINTGVLHSVSEGEMIQAIWMFADYVSHLVGGKNREVFKRTQQGI